MCGSLCGNDFQLRTNYWSVRASGVGLLVGGIGDFEETYPSWSIFGGNAGGGYELNLQMYRPTNEDPESGAFSGMGGSAGYAHLWEADGGETDLFNAQFHLFLSDAQLAAAVGPALLHRTTDGGGTQWGGALDVDIIYRLRSPMLDNPVVNPFLQAGVLIGGIGGEGEGGFVLGVGVGFGIEFGWL